MRNLLKGRIVYIPIRRPSSRKSEVESLSSATCAKALSLAVIYIIYIRHRLCSPPQADLPEAYLKAGRPSILRSNTLLLAERGYVG